MRILLLGFTKMKFMPYASFYLDKIDCKKNSVEIVYWNRDLQDEDLDRYDKSIVFHEFRAQMEDSIDKYRKLKFFYQYRKFVKKLLKRKDFDFIISLHTLPGLLVLDSLCRLYSKRYILDYRDSTFENNALFGRMVRKLALNAHTVFVSSDGFRQFLPTERVETITSHNILEDSLSHRDDRKNGLVKSERIRISFWGLLRHYKHNLKIVDGLANDPRFELHYYGRELSMGRMLREYITQKNIHNVFLHGEYRPEDRYEFVKRTDIIHNSYLDNNTLLAMGNKYYDGLIFRIPQLCMPGSYMAMRCVDKGVGFAIDPSDHNFADKIYEAYQKIDWEQFEMNCDRDLQVIIEEYRLGGNRINSLLNNQI